MIDYIEKFSLKNKTVVVVGGLGLLGKEIATAIAQAGALVIIADICDSRGKEFSDGLKDAGYEAIYINFDIADLNNLEGSIKQLFGSYRDLSGWVNSAYPRTKDWGSGEEEINPGSWRMNIDMQMNSYCLSSWHVAVMMSKHNGGSIVNIGSVYGIVGNDFAVYEGTGKFPPPGYTAIKGGVTSFTRYLASYFGSKKVRVNTLSPSGIFNNQNNKMFIKNYENRCPMKRMGRSDEIAPGALFLLSNAASYVTGITLIIDGGWTAI